MDYKNINLSARVEEISNITLAEKKRGICDEAVGEGSNKGK